MNLQNFFNNLDESEKVEFDNIVRNWALKNAEDKAKTIVLTGYEETMINVGKKINAIKSIKDRYNCTMLAAKFAIDLYIERCKADQAYEVD